MTKQIIFPFSPPLPVVLVLTFAFQTKAQQINELNACTPLANKALSDVLCKWLTGEGLFFPKVVSW